MRGPAQKPAAAAPKVDPCNPPPQKHGLSLADRLQPGGVKRTADGEPTKKPPARGLVRWGVELPLQPEGKRERVPPPQRCSKYFL